MTLSLQTVLQQYWNSSQPYKYVSVQAFAELFKNFHVGQDIAQRLAQPPEKQPHDSEGATPLLIKKKYALSKTQLFKACWEVSFHALTAVPALAYAAGATALLHEAKPFGS